MIEGVQMTNAPGERDRDLLAVSQVRLMGPSRVEPVALASLARFMPIAAGDIVLWLAALAGAFLLGIAQVSAQQQFMTIEGDLKTSAWWVVADFHPFTNDVRGIPANQIRKNWCKATEFRKDLIPSALLFEGGVDAMEARKLSFAVEGQFDGSATKQVVLVGVYQECAGQKGRFVLILDQPASGKPKIRFVDAVQTDRQFGALSKGDDNTLVVWACMECDATSVLKWDRKRRKFDWLPDKDDQ